MTGTHAAAARTPAWGSDVVAEALLALGIEHVALNPGASFRGLHDSLVNYLGSAAPTLLLCLHEEHAVAIAHGYAKVAERPMAVVLHSNVGLMHASMALFNAWCDRVPVFALGATGPVDAARRRPWIDWIHTSRDQAALVRGFTKWDDQPGSIAALQDGLLRAHRIGTTLPKAPTYVVLDAALQEAPLDAPVPPLDLTRHRAPGGPAPLPADLDEAFRRLSAAARPVILAGRGSRSPDAWAARVTLAERLGARVLTDLKTPAAFPTGHPLHAAPAGLFLSAEGQRVLASADVVLALDWIDLGGTLRMAGAHPATIVNASPDELLARPEHGDHQALAPADILLLADPDLVVAGLVARLAARPAPAPMPPPAARPLPASGPIVVPELAVGLRVALSGRETSLVRAPLSWAGDDWPIAHPLDYLGYDGGGGIGSGPGMAVGAALALRGTDRLPVAVLGDGDTLMGVTALWTAAQHKLPLLVVVANNRSYFNDEIHQERVAITRGRPVENKWIGQAIRDPDVDIAAMARAQGCVAFGPVRDRSELAATLAAAVAAAADGPVLVDVEVAGGYTPAMTAALSREGGEG